MTSHITWGKNHKVPVPLLRLSGWQRFPLSLSLLSLQSQVSSYLSSPEQLLGPPFLPCSPTLLPPPFLFSARKIQIFVASYLYLVSINQLHRICQTQTEAKNCNITKTVKSFLAQILMFSCCHERPESLTVSWWQSERCLYILGLLAQDMGRVVRRRQDVRHRTPSCGP